ncbi:SusC/RagA family TonB-linked outer membrane protein [Mucilaginibacter sp. L196]|uniref:SusC/RagA family TonB-linked outer membrane protein n=1 Tax=Mucilaginibacter sp. L196 TaxID=1641870 RepID=UPI0020B151C3|nr:SusC/RagA family TonB-linked outer membrane protein [Mucilaginibacter sp. L196]
MKLTALIITIAILHVSANVVAQKVTLNERQVSLDKVFKDIRTQTGYDFLIGNGLIEKAGLVTIDVKNADLKDVLNIILQAPLTYEMVNKTVVVKNQEASFFDNLKDKAAKLLTLPANITGRVIDSLGQPLVGASVSLKETKYNTLTDSKGDFTFSSVPQGKYTVIVNYIGYARFEKNIEVEGRDLRIVLVAHTSISSLDQVQIIGYGTESKRFSVGSVATVTAEDIGKQPVTNPLLSLEGQAPGLAVTAMNGVPGSTVLVQVRGQNTLGTTSLGQKPYDQPLFIVDGVPFATGNANISQLSNLALAQTYSGGINQETGLSPFNGINPNDIESITILKDADATSIYGSEGANGVILITTKKGKPGKTTFDLNLNTQFNSAAQPVQLLNTQQYLQLRKDAFAVDGITPSSNPNDPGYAPDLTIFDQNKYTNWEKIIAGNTTNNTDVHASVSGGTANNTFLVSTGYTRSDYNYPGDFADQRYTLHSALHSTSADKRFSIDLVTDYGYDQNNSAGFGGSQDVVLPPNLPDLIDPAGNLIWNYKGVPLNVQNFYSSLKQPAYLQNFNFNSSLNLSYQILQGLTIGANLGYSRNTTSENSEDPASSQDPSYAQANASFANNAAQTINIEPQINYNKSIGKGTLSALLGGTYKKNTTDASQTLAYGYSNDAFLGSIDGATSTYPYDAANIVKYSAAFARLKYIYDQKYIIEFTGRRDGSSNFGPGRQFGNFGSVGAGWIFSEEKIFKEALPFFSYGKLSGSYGTTGGDASQAYSYQALYQNLSYVPAYQNIKQSYPYNLYNPDFSWATKKSLNLALDLGFFNNRLLLNATYYRDREGDQLVSYPLPAQAGFPSVFGNLNATIQNQGWEFTASSTNIKTKDFTWTTNFNLTFNRNKLLSFPNLASSPYATQYIIGQPTSIVFGYRYKDVNPTTGLFEFYDKNGNVTSNPTYGTAATGGDEVPIANREVNYMGGFGNNFTYKHFNLYIFCQFSSGDAPNYLSEVYGVNYPGAMQNQPEAILNNYWKAPGDHATLQRLASSYNSSVTSAGDFAQSSGAYGNDTYLRVKTAALSYALPDAFLKKVHVKGGSIYVNAQNLLTITNYKVGDPEQPGSYTSFPLQRIVAFGLNLKF